MKDTKDIGKVIIDKSLSQELTGLGQKLLAGFRDDGTIYITDAVPIKEGTSIKELERILESRELYPTEKMFDRGPGFPSLKKECLGTYGICNVSGNYDVVIVNQDSRLVAFTYPKMHSLELYIEPF